jgi:Asp-tRNA(Asn)/Glu-tRNA(Gln) amidotransferase A subunit family amidase
VSIPVLASAGELARLVATRALSPVELVGATLERIERLNPSLNAYVAVDAKGALSAARAAEARVIAGERLGPLHGVPVSIKSSIAVEGLPWETGTRFRRGVTGDVDAPLVTRLKAAGAIVMGVTNVAEQLMAWETDNALYGRTNSPWALDRTPGGSSGGEAAAIAAGLSAGGVGSDGGGSIRVPAHFSGICGLKPTPGRVPATGHFPPCGGPFALTGVVGPMARTVDDVEALLTAMAGPDIGDPNGHPVPFTPLASLPKGTVIGVFEDDGLVPVSAETRAAVRKAAGWLADAGYTVDAFRPDGLEEARVLWWEIFGRASRLLLEPLVNGREAEVHPNLLQFLDWTRREPKLTAERLLDVEISRDLLKSRVAAQMGQHPVLLCPSAPIPAFRHGERTWMIDGQEVHYLDAWRYTAWFNLLQNPGMVVPVTQTTEGLPIGVQLVAAPWNEALTIAAARIIERARGAWVPPPAPFGTT